MNKKDILLVEDNADDIALTLRAFKKNNVANEVVVVHDGQEALDYLLGKPGDPPDKGAEKPAIILLDLKLPKISGLEVLERLRSDERTKFLPIIVLTSSKEEQDMISSYKFGANSYICKPVNFNKFVEAVRQLELYWIVLNEFPKSI
jgi:two-component system, response regulator